MSRVLCAVGALAVLALVAPAHGESAPPTVRFLGSDPIGPLAVVRAGVLQTPAVRACRSWGPVGSQWRELDALGGIAGVVTIARRERYAYTGCDELTIRRIGGHRGAGVFVDARVTYRAPRVASWRPDRSALVALEALADARQRPIRRLEPEIRVPFAKRVLSLEWSSNGERYAIVGGRSLLVAALRGGRWLVVHEEKPAPEGARDDGYMVLTVTDMNGDDRPEIVVHMKELSGEWYGDFTLSLGADGAWRRVGAGIFGSTA